MGTVNLIVIVRMQNALALLTVFTKKTASYGSLILLWSLLSLCAFFQVSLMNVSHKSQGAFFLLKAFLCFLHHWSPESIFCYLGICHRIWYWEGTPKNNNHNIRGPWKSQVSCTLFRFRFYPFLLMKTLSVHIAPFSNEYAMKIIGVHTAPAKRRC